MIKNVFNTIYKLSLKASMMLSLIQTMTGGVQQISSTAKLAYDDIIMLYTLP